jgi:hypothetical protein
LADVLYNDSSARSLLNQGGRYTIDLRNNADLYDAFNRILRVLEYADADY